MSEAVVPVKRVLIPSEARIPEVSGLAITGVEKVPLFEVPAERLTFSPLPMLIGEPGV